MADKRSTPARLRACARAVVAVAGAIAIVGAVAVAAPERASATALAGGASYSKTTVIDKKITKKYVNKAKQLGACTVGTAGAHCSFSIHKSITNTWQTSLGLSAKSLAASLGWSYAASTSYSVTCTSPTMKKGQTWHMYPRGTKATYKIRQLMATQFRTTTKTSGTLTSFKAGTNDFYCE